MGWPKEPTDAQRREALDRAYHASMQRSCKRCGVTFAHHGASWPHTRGEECAGFMLTGAPDIKGGRS
jgi:hypothetical protein